MTRISLARAVVHHANRALAHLVRQLGGPLNGSILKTWSLPETLVTSAKHSDKVVLNQ